MAEHLLDNLDVRSRRYGEGRSCVAQLVRVQGGDADGGRSGRESASERRDAQRCAVSDAGEHEVVEFLGGNMSGEFFDKEPGDGHLAPLVGLRGSPDEALALNWRHRLRDHRPATSEVEASHFERRHFAEPDAGVGEEEHHEAVGLVFPLVEAAVLTDARRPANGLSKGVDLGVAEVSLLHSDRTREVDSGSDIASHASVFDCHVEDERQHAVDFADGGR